MTESTKKLIDAAVASGEKVINNSTLVLSYDEGEDVGRIYHDGMMYGAGRISLSEIDEGELANDGVRIWRAWHWGGNAK